MPRFSLHLALAWTAFVTATLWAGLVTAVLLVPQAARGIVLLGAVQVVVYALVLALFRRANGGSFREILALRKATPALCLSSAFLGFTLQIPATLVSDAIEHFFPSPPGETAARMARITPHGPAQAVAIVVVVALLGPLIEEFFFRGALFGALRRGHDAFVTAVAVALLFSVAHLDARLLVPLFGTALVIGDVREHSGSIWPGFALHAAFNGATLAAVFSGAAPNGNPPAIPAFFAALSCLACASLFVTTRRLALSSRVAQNRSQS